MADFLDMPYVHLKVNFAIPEGSALLFAVSKHTLGHGEAASVWLDVVAGLQSELPGCVEIFRVRALYAPTCADTVYVFTMQETHCAN